MKRKIFAVTVFIVAFVATFYGVFWYMNRRTEPHGLTYKRTGGPIVNASILPDVRMRSWVLGTQPIVDSGKIDIDGNIESMTVAYHTVASRADILIAFREYMEKTGWAVGPVSDDPEYTFIAGVKRYQLLDGDTAITARISESIGFRSVIVNIVGPKPVEASG